MLVESACELDDDLINKYLEGEEITTEELAGALRVGRARAEAVPGAGRRRAAASIGLEPLLNAIVQLLPSPIDVEATLANGSAVHANDKLAALVFKTVSDPNIGRLSYVRVYSGTLTADSHVWSVQKSKDERVGQVFHIRGKTQEPTQRLVTGDIGVIPKLAESVTGDTLSTKDAVDRAGRDRLSGGRLLRLGASQVAQRRGQAEQGDVAAARRRPEPADASRDLDQRGDPVGAGRLASRGRDAAAAAQVRRERHAGRAQGGLPRDDHGQGGGRRPPRAPVWRARPVRRGQPGGRAARRGAKASSSSTRSSAAWCRGSSFRRSRRACARRWSRA